MSLQENESRSLKTIMETFELVSRGSNSQRNILPAETVGQRVESLREQSHAPVNRSIEAKVQFVEALKPITDGITKAFEDRFCGEARIAGGLPARVSGGWHGEHGHQKLRYALRCGAALR